MTTGNRALRGAALGWALAVALAAAPQTAPPGASGASVPLRFDSDAGGRIEASVYSLPSRTLAAPECLAFLRAVRAAAPHRTLTVLADDRQERALRAEARTLGIRLITTSRADYSPWPRDPFSLAHDSAGKIVVVTQPNPRLGREADTEMAREWVRGLPPDLIRAWGAPRIAVAEMPFHNGQVLLTDDTVWLSLHTLEPHILALLGLDRVPVEEFAYPAGIERYVRAAHQAAAAIGELYHRTPKFVHALPEAGDFAARHDLLAALAGGAGFDLDSILTLIPSPAGLQALVGDVGGGALWVGGLDATELEALRTGFKFAPLTDPSPGALAESLGRAQQERRAVALGAFLDQIAAHLAASGATVRRLPLLLVPTRLLAGADPGGAPDFVLGWNNVVMETTPRGVRAEGFSSLIPAGDASARKIFAEAGAALDLFPPLVPGVILGGGYRSASNQLKTKQ